MRLTARQARRNIGRLAPGPALAPGAYLQGHPVTDPILLTPPHETSSRVPRARQPRSSSLSTIGPLFLFAPYLPRRVPHRPALGLSNHLRARQGTEHRESDYATSCTPLISQDAAPVSLSRLPLAARRYKSGQSVCHVGVTLIQFLGKSFRITFAKPVSRFRFHV